MSKDAIVFELFSSFINISYCLMDWRMEIVDHLLNKKKKPLTARAVFWLKSHVGNLLHQRLNSEY